MPQRKTTAVYILKTTTVQCLVFQGAKVGVTQKNYMTESRTWEAGLLLIEGRQCSLPGGKYSSRKEASRFGYLEIKSFTGMKPTVRSIPGCCRRYLAQSRLSGRLLG